MEPLTGSTEQRKRPVILYIIIGVLLIVVIVLSILLGIKSADKEEEEKNEVFNPLKEDHFIKITDSFILMILMMEQIHIMEVEII